MASSRTTVYVAEDHPIYLEGLVRTLGGRADLQIVGSSDDGRTAWEQIQELRPDVAILDMRLPRMTGLEILGAIRRHELPVKAMILSGETSGDLVFEAVRLGVDGYLAKESNRDEVADAVAAIARGGTVFSSAVQAVLASEVRGREHEERPILSPRERQVLRLIADGLSGPAIAKELQIGVATVKSHTQNVYEKLGVPERAAAVAEAMRRGLLE
ncbi:response regulator transcription factor [Patulibacter defluvii]|uniref:response regulator transcription factor n=1 Tax=Patulibacter defluvii TaxID=3095358 RepID=UPI002A7496B4|nr:response regulator transcription factor [Patulibacter sp. DM4]